MRILLSILCLFSPIAAAQIQGVGINLDEIRAAATSRPHEDEAVTMLKGVLGEDFASLNPFQTTLSSSSLIGDLFFVFNACVFALGVAYVGYLIVFTIAQSASDGSFMSKSSDGTWGPVRVGFGVFGMMPAFGGFSLAQAVMMMSIMLGIGIGNLTLDAALKSTRDFKAITPSVSAPSAAPNLATDITTAVRGAVLAEMCLEGYNYGIFITKSTAPTVRAVISQTPTVTRVEYPGCGVLEMKLRGGTSPREGGSVNFRSSAVDYDSIRLAVHNAAVTELQRIRLEASAIAQGYFDAFHAAGENADYMELALQAQAMVEELERQSRSRISNAVRDSFYSDEGAVKDGALQAIRDGGWMRLGSYFAVFSEVSAAIADSQRSFEIGFTPGYYIEQVLDGDIDTLPISRSLYAFLSARDAVKATVSGESSFIDTVLDTIYPENSLGERSLGQHLALQLTSVIASDSGGAGLVNPVSAAKNLGDWMMVLGQSIHAVDIASDFLPAAKATAVLSSVQSSVVGRAVAKTVGKVGGFVGWSMIGMGLFLSVFIPLSIFATWVSAILAYLTSIFEALLYAQLSAFAHLKMRGEGVADAGSPAAKFYIYLVNSLLRPGVMVISFFLMMSLMIGVGTFFVSAFSSALASAQGNSTTGVLTIMAIIAFFSVFLFGLVQTCANLIIEIPDRLLGWVGGGGERSDRSFVMLGASLKSVQQLSPGKVNSPASSAVKTASPGPGSGKQS